MRPDRLIVGEVREAEALDMLVALNSGLAGMCTIHANSAADALTKLCTLPLLAGEKVRTGECTVNGNRALALGARRGFRSRPPVPVEYGEIGGNPEGWVPGTVAGPTGVSTFLVHRGGRGRMLTPPPRVCAGHSRGLVGATLKSTFGPTRRKPGGFFVCGVGPRAGGCYIEVNIRTHPAQAGWVLCWRMLGIAGVAYARSVSFARSG